MLEAGQSCRFAGPSGHLIPRPKYARFKNRMWEQKVKEGCSPALQESRAKREFILYFCHHNATCYIVFPLIISVLQNYLLNNKWVKADLTHIL